jgi:hypothetical protein
MNVRLLLLIAAPAAFLAGCASVTGGIAFQAPATGWTGTPPLFGHAQAWVKQIGKDRMEMVFLVKGTPKTVHADFSDVPANYAHNMDTMHISTVKLCGTQPASLMEARGEDKNGDRMAVEMVETDIGSDRYAAFYMRPWTVPADPQAEAAIRSLCPLKQQG